MSKFYERIRAALKQTQQPVNEQNLLSAGFFRRGDKFLMGDLTIFKIGVAFYYKNKKYAFTECKNMHVVSNLVYGKINYGR